MNARSVSQGFNRKRDLPILPETPDLAAKEFQFF